MQPSLPRNPRFVGFVRLCRCGVLLLALSALGAACDRHSADEVPESYGHGSAHGVVDYKGHQIDSRTQSNHFSDSQGLKVEGGVPERPEGGAAERQPGSTPNPMGIGR